MKKKDMEMKTREEIQEEVSGTKKRSTGIHYINSNKCTSRIVVFTKLSFSLIYPKLSCIEDYKPVSRTFTA
jgi:hypothetical protein